MFVEADNDLHKIPFFLFLKYAISTKAKSLLLTQHSFFVFCLAFAITCKDKWHSQVVPD